MRAVRSGALRLFAGDRHVNHADYRGAHGSCEDGGLGSEHLEGLGGERKARDQNRHGEPDAAQDTNAHDVPPRHPAWQFGNAKLHQQKCYPHNADGLAQQHAKVRTHGHGVECQLHHIDAHQAHLSVHESKQRQDDKVNRRRDLTLEADERGRDAMHNALGTQGGVREVVLSQDMRILIVRIDQVGHITAQPVSQVVQADARARGNRERHNDARERGMHARLEQAHPEDESTHHIRRQAVMLRLVEHEQGCGHHSGG